MKDPLEIFFWNLEKYGNYNHAQTTILNEYISAWEQHNGQHTKVHLDHEIFIHIFLRNYQFLIVPWIKTMQRKYHNSQIFIKNFNQPRISLKTFVTILYHQNTVVHINKSQIETNAYFIEDCDTEYSVLLQFTVKFG